MSQLLIICGPTATGKTKLAIELAKKFDGELVSADSRQVYRGMDIGTGKDLIPISNFKFQISKIRYENKYVGFYVTQGVPIWLYDVVSPDQEFSVVHYQALARQIISDIQKRGKLPIVVGGTGLYIQAILESKTDMSVPPNISLRKELSHFSVSALQERLDSLDHTIFESMNHSDRQNPRRLVRKIEILTARTHKPPVQMQEINRMTYDVLSIGLTSDTKTLYPQIDKRVQERVIQGVEQEIADLLGKGYTWELPSLSALGYRQWRGYFEKTQKKQDVIQVWKFAEHAYARKQRTWFRKQPNIQWYSCDDADRYVKIESRVRDWRQTDI